ncbi:MAG: hypothetical protein LBT54_01450 [Bifidobacteriaceae bacterium]|nr:hypothetical protein [Bifidobacteriaceae bacterium]
MSWRFGELTGEALANVGPKHRALGLVVVAVLSAIGCLLGLQGGRAIEQARAQRDAGSAVVVVIAGESRPLSAARCEALGGLGGVEAAGGVGLDRPDNPVAFAGGPGLVARYVTPGAVRVWSRRAPLGTALVGPELIAVNALAGNSILFWADGATTRLGGVAPEPLPPAGLRDAVLVPRAPEFGLSECWLRLAPGMVDRGLELAEFAFSGHDAVVTPHIKPDPNLASPLEQWTAVAGMRPWLAGGAVIAVVGALMTWTRRSEFAVYRTFGTTTGQIGWMVFTESAAVMVPAALAAVPICLLATGQLVPGGFSGELALVVARTVAAAALLGLAGATALGMIATRGNLAAQLKDR